MVCFRKYTQLVSTFVRRRQPRHDKTPLKTPLPSPALASIDSFPSAVRTPSPPLSSPIDISDVLLTSVLISISLRLIQSPQHCFTWEGFVGVFRLPESAFCRGCWVFPMEVAVGQMIWLSSSPLCARLNLLALSFSLHNLHDEDRSPYVVLDLDHHKVYELRVNICAMASSAETSQLSTCLTIFLETSVLMDQPLVSRMRKSIV